jgi:hypothetical protein
MPLGRHRISKRLRSFSADFLSEISVTFCSKSVFAHS